MARLNTTAPNLKTYSFEWGVEPEVKLTNFWPPEDGFVWSTNRWCEITFPVTPATRSEGAGVEIAVDIDVFKCPPDLLSQNVFVYVNGLRVLSREIYQRVILLIQVPMTQLRKGENVLIIDTPDAATPTEHGVNDTRRLGVQIFSITVRSA